MYIIYKSTNLQIYKSIILQIYKSTNLQIYICVTMITILFGINNKDDDENQDPDQENFEYWRVETIKEPLEGTCS